MHEDLQSDVHLTVDLYFRASRAFFLYNRFFVSLRPISLSCVQQIFTHKHLFHMCQWKTPSNRRFVWCAWFCSKDESGWRLLMEILNRWPHLRVVYLVKYCHTRVVFLWASPLSNEKTKRHNTLLHNRWHLLFKIGPCGKYICLRDVVGEGVEMRWLKKPYPSWPKEMVKNTRAYKILHGTN